MGGRALLSAEAESERVAENLGWADDGRAERVLESSGTRDGRAGTELERASLARLPARAGDAEEIRRSHSTSDCRKLLRLRRACIADSVTGRQLSVETEAERDRRGFRRWNRLWFQEEATAAIAFGLRL